MIPENIPITPGMIARQDDGLLYRVEIVSRDTDDYELNHALNGLKKIAYTQLQDGSFPAGTPWDKSEAGFRKHFTVEELSASELNDLGLVQE